MQQSRRSFLKWSGAALMALPFASAILPGVSHGKPGKAADLPPLKESEPMAKSLKYCEDGDKPSAACPERRNKDKRGQHCYNCQLYTKLRGEKKTEVGKCLLFPKNTVTGPGWCMSWVKKP
jgi:hypothetical protein